MRVVACCLVVVGLALALLLAACGGAASPTQRRCDSQGLCVDLDVVGPIRADHPLTLTIAVESQERFIDLPVRVWASDPDIVFVGAREWAIAIEPGVTLHLSTTIRFPKQVGVYRIHAGVLHPDGRVVQDVVPVEMTGAVGTAYPQDQSTPGAPMLIEQITPTLSPEARSPVLPVRSIAPELSSQGRMLVMDMGSWVQIGSEDFESVFPTAMAPWVLQDLSYDGAERTWDDDDYCVYAGGWAAWPANGGADGVSPAPGADAYPHNVDARMIYGPFDLRDAVAALTQFYLWYEIESPYDYLSFEISRDGVVFEELARWSGDQPVWTLQQVTYDDYLGDNAVWVAWRFHSDASIAKQGPWIDAISIWKLIPGEVTVRGTLHYYNRADDYVPARSVQVSLYEDDGAAGSGGGDDLLAVTRTDSQGAFAFSPQVNWDVDDPSGEVDGHALDLYLVWETQDALSGQRVSDFSDWVYGFSSETFVDVPSGTMDAAYYVPDGANWEPAMWIFQDLYRGWAYVHDVVEADAGDLIARWERTLPPSPPCEGTCFLPSGPFQGIFIDDLGAESADIVLHEQGHAFMYNAIGNWWASNTEAMEACLEHSMCVPINPLCAWSEGWANFFPLVVNGDPCFDWDGLSCQGLTINLEIPTWDSLGWQDGGEVEGRVAGALYDLFDADDDGLDQAHFGFAPIWHVFAEDASEYSFADFWAHWKLSTSNGHAAVQALYQNTVNYNTSPSMQLPDCNALEGGTNSLVLDLEEYTVDAESEVSELVWNLVSVSDEHCETVCVEVSNVLATFPATVWYGACDVTIRVTDGLATVTDTFRLQVVPVASRVYAPLIVRMH